MKVACPASTVPHINKKNRKEVSGKLCISQNKKKVKWSKKCASTYYSGITYSFVTYLRTTEESFS